MKGLIEPIITMQSDMARFEADSTLRMVIRKKAVKESLHDHVHVHQNYHNLGLRPK